MMGLAISVVATALLTYPLANMLSSDQVSHWISAAIASVLPLASVLFARAEPRDATALAPVADVPPAKKRRVFLRYCACLFVIVGIIETVRNLLLGGTALVFYAGAANLGGLALKVACSAWLLTIFDAHDARGVSVVYRTAFVLLLGVVLCIPYLLEGTWFAHTLLDISAFFFQLVMVLVAFEISIGFSLNPVLVFGAARGVWAAAALVGHRAQQRLPRVGSGSRPTACRAAGHRRRRGVHVRLHRPRLRRHPFEPSRCPSIRLVSRPSANGWHNEPASRNASLK